MIEEILQTVNQCITDSWKQKYQLSVEKLKKQFFIYFFNVNMFDLFGITYLINKNKNIPIIID